jgi:hypothetical protein
MGYEDRSRMARAMLVILFPKVTKFFKVSFVNRAATDFIVGVIR